jgi:hypothetical protein
VKLARVRFTVRRMMVAVAVVGFFLASADAIRVYGLASKYRRKAESCALMARRCGQIDAMDPATRAREAAFAMDNPYLEYPDWNRQMIGYYAALKVKYEHAADHPRLPIPPDPPAP